jgi:hypothetical protein
MIKLAIFENKAFLEIFSTGVDALPLEPEMTVVRLANGA